MRASRATFYFLITALALALPAIGFVYLRLADTPSTKGSSQAKCQLAHAAQIYDGLSALPPYIGRDLRQRVDDGMFAGIADANRPFNVTDVVNPVLPMQRFLRAGSWDRYVFVWYEHGGLGYHVHLALYERKAENGTFAPSGIYYVLDVTQLCPATDALLDGKDSSALLASNNHW